MCYHGGLVSPGDLLAFISPVLELELGLASFSWIQCLNSRPGVRQASTSSTELSSSSKFQLGFSKVFSKRHVLNVSHIPALSALFTAVQFWKHQNRFRIWEPRPRAQAMREDYKASGWWGCDTDLCSRLFWY